MKELDDVTALIEVMAGELDSLPIAQVKDVPTPAAPDAGEPERLDGPDVVLDRLGVPPAGRGEDPPPATDPNWRGRPFSSVISKVSSASKTGPV